MANPDSEHKIGRKIDKAGVEIVSNVYYVIIGLFMSLGAQFMIQFLNIEFPPAHQVGYLLAFALGSFVIAIYTVIRVAKFREKNP